MRVIGVDGKQLGVISLGEAINLARASGVDLVEIAATANPPVCRLVDFGKFRYEQAKKDKESKKHHHANKIKEIQLSPKIDPHDLGVKLSHAIDFICEDMKVKLVLKFRGREMAHTEFGFQLIAKFLKDIAPYAHPDSTPRLIGRAINVMLSPLPRNKRAKNPRQPESEERPPQPQHDEADRHNSNHSQNHPNGSAHAAPSEPNEPGERPATPQQDEFTNNPFSRLESQ